MLCPMEWYSTDDNAHHARRFWTARLRAAAVHAGIPRGPGGIWRESWIDDRVHHAETLFCNGKPFDPAELPRALRRPLAWLRKALYRLPNGSSRRRAEWRPYVPSSSSRGDNPATIAAIREEYPTAPTEALIGTPGQEIPSQAVRVAGGTNRPPADGQIVPTVKVIREWIENGEERFEIETGWKMSRTYHHQTEWSAGSVRDSITVAWRFSPPADPIQPGPEWTPAPGRPCPAMIHQWRREGLTYAADQE